MKVTLYMAITANGYVAGMGDETPWSQEEWEAYGAFVREKGNLIIGRRTYELMAQEDEFSRVGNPTVVVVSRWLTPSETDHMTVVQSPEDALAALEARGFREAVVGGGSMLNAGFLRAGLLDEAMLDVEPYFFGSGIRLFSDIDTTTALTLLDIRKLSDSVVRLHYRVNR
jgi:dihydrofolate reductase